MSVSVVSVVRDDFMVLVGLTALTTWWLLLLWLFVVVVVVVAVVVVVVAPFLQIITECCFAVVFVYCYL